MVDISHSLIDQVKTAHAEKTALLIQAGQTKQHIIGREVSGQILNITEHSGIIDYKPSELVLTARAGTTLAEIQGVLSEHKQILSFEPPLHGGAATLGGSLACNQSGPSRPWSGSIRDMVLGVRLINGLGQHLTFGGQVIKNVAGYDVARLQAGALGCLGVLTEISLKVLPKPESNITIVQEMSQSQAIDKMNALAGLPKPLSGSAWLDNRLHLRLSGEHKAISQAAKQWGGEQLDSQDSFWHDLTEHKLSLLTKDEPLWRFSIRQTAQQLMPEVETILDWSGAQRWISGAFGFEDMQKIATRAGGHVCLFKGGDRAGETRQSLSAVEQKLQANLKLSFDPHRILNPGRLYSWM